MTHKETLGYSIHEYDLQATRDMTVKVNNNRFRILMDLAHGCYGNCQGCSMSVIDKVKPNPLDIAKLREHLSAFVPIINARDDLYSTNVNYGIGDYFLYDEDSLEGLAEATADYFNQLHVERNVISLSTSLLNKGHKLQGKVERLLRHLAPTQIIFDSVIDPARLEEHFEDYLANIQLLTQQSRFFLDVAINIHKDLTPAHARQFYEFVKQANIMNLDLQYAVNNTNTYKVYTDSDAFKPFLETLWNLLVKDHNEELLTQSITIPQIDSSMSIMELISKTTQDGFDGRILLDSEGKAWYVAFGLGDMLIDSRYTVKGHAIPSLGEIQNGVFIPNPKAKRLLERVLLKSASSEACMECTYQKTCYGSGYGWYHLHSPHPRMCGNPARAVFEIMKI
ncbi:hypothetical protein [Flavobacterium sp.]|jgi:hypothetical protein|uniref:hypothetical protein n=1 Tax=Flavobacterium sp. TaxID=239 RepID=UPI0037BFCDE0